MKEKVLLGMSGGVDSSVAAIMLQRQGYGVIGVTMNLWKPKTESSINNAVDAKKVCDYLKISHITFDFTKEFEKYVIQDFICQYQKCKTPNPCIECNKYLKFGSMYEKAQELGCKYLATGHYAKTEYDEKYKKIVLKKADNAKKDQSYVLYGIPSEILENMKFPLGEFTDKEEIRQIARECNLPVANKPDSEDICFIPDGNYKNFIQNYANMENKTGNIVNRSGQVLGKHNGLYGYTIGQRRGLGIANTVPLFVLGFNKEKNELIVGEEKELYQKEFMVSNINLLALDKIKGELAVQVKTRYSAKVAEATIKQENSKIRVTLKEPQKAITPGQSAVFYDQNIVLGGGKIQ